MRRTLAAAVALGLLLVAPRAPAAAAAATAIPTESEILALSPEMGRFLARRIKPGLVRQARLQTLLDVIFGAEGLGITYGNTRTRTAVETFRERSGNCLSFTLMFVSMARHLGLNAYFREVDEVTSWDQRGNVVVTGRHMFAEVEADNGLIQVDFLPGTGKLYRSTRRIATPRVYAHFYSNLGVERLAEGGAADAIALFERALAHDERFSQALVNLGVAYRRLGDTERAEASFQQALEADPGEMAAATNLAALYLAQGLQSEAEPWLDRVARYLRRNPFYHFRKGLRAEKEEDWEAAMGHLREAIRRQPGEAFFHVELARLQARTGRARQARAGLERALELADGEAERQRIRSLLTELGPPL
jgi:tetratricopeptide (TPR) repeat protein